MNRKLLLSGILLAFAVYTGACPAAAMAKNTKNVKETEVQSQEVQLQAEVERLKKEVASLQVQLNNQKQEYNKLKNEFGSLEKEKEGLSFEVTKMKIIGKVQGRPNAEQIKVALINAGYHPGPISMNIDKETIDAIRAFQRDNNLMADGVMGKKTWNALKKYLYEKKE